MLFIWGEKWDSAVIRLCKVLSILWVCSSSYGIEECVRSSCETLESFFHEVPENR